MIWNCFGSLDSDERIFSKWQTNWKRSSNIWIGRARYLPFSQAGEQRWIFVNNEHQHTDNSSSNGLSWTAPVPHFFVCFLLLLLLFVCFFFFFFFRFILYIIIFFSLLSLSEEVFLTAVCAFERQTKFVKSWVFPFAFSASTFFLCRAGKKDWINWRACVEALITGKPQNEFHHLKITDS